MRQYNLLATDVDIKELAVETKNYSGAELEGLVRAAQSTAMNRHIKVRFSLFQGFFDMCIVKTEKRKENTVHLIRNKYYMNPGAVQVFIMFGLKRFIRCTGSNLHSSLLHTDKKKFSSVKCSAPTGAYTQILEGDDKWRTRGVQISDGSDAFLHSSKQLFFPPSPCLTFLLRGERCLMARWAI